MKTIIFALVISVASVANAQCSNCSPPVSPPPYALQPVPFGFRVFHPFYVGRLRTAYQIQQLQQQLPQGRWAWQPGRYEFVPQGQQQ